MGSGFSSVFWVFSGLVLLLILIISNSSLFDLSTRDLLETEQTRRSQALEEQLMAVRRSLEDHQKSTHNLHSHLASQLEVVQSPVYY